MKELTDTQNELDDRQIAMDRVGVKALRFPMQVRNKDGSTPRTVATTALAVDLPHHLKGTHMSRFVEVLNSHGNCLDVREMTAIPEELLVGWKPARHMLSFGFLFFGVSRRQ